jgi:hypothetical protein
MQFVVDFNSAEKSHKYAIRGLRDPNLIRLDCHLMVFGIGDLRIGKPGQRRVATKQFSRRTLDGGEASGVGKSGTANSEIHAGDCISCRACEAAFGDAVAARPAHEVFLKHRVAWVHDDFVAERSLASSAVATGD